MSIFKEEHDVCIFPIFLNSPNVNTIDPLCIKLWMFPGNPNISMFKLYFLYCQTYTKMLQSSFLWPYSLNFWCWKCKLLYSSMEYFIFCVYFAQPFIFLLGVLRTDWCVPIPTSLSFLLTHHYLFLLEHVFPFASHNLPHFLCFRSSYKHSCSLTRFSEKGNNEIHTQLYKT